MAILTSIVPPQSRGKALGFISATTYMGLSCGPPLGGLISSAFSWRAVFVFNMAIALFVLFLTGWKLKGEWKGEASKIDGGGIVFCILAQGLMLFGLNNLASGLLHQASFVLGLILLVVFFIYEKRHSNPLIQLESIMKNRTFAFSNLSALINYSATFAMTFLISLYLQAALQLDAVFAGLILLIQPVIMVVLSPVAGLLSDKLPSRVLASIGMVICVFSLFLFIFLSAETPVLYVIFILSLTGVGFALFITPNTNAIMSSVDKTLYGVASSILGNMRLIGQSLSMAIVSLITSVFIRDMSIASAGYVDGLLISIRTSFIVFAALGCLGVLSSLVKAR